MKEEDGLGTVEIVVIIAVLLGIALLFRKYIFDFVRNILDKIFNNPDVKDIKENPLGINNITSIS